MSKDASVSDLEQVLGHKFARPEFLTEALTHRGAAGDEFRFGYERLEFLGDRVLGLIVADLLLATYPGDAEGPLARRFTGLVRREALEQVAWSMELDQYLILDSNEGLGRLRTNSRAAGKIMADALEAIIGALYLDGGLDVARRFIGDHWQGLLEREVGAVGDAKTRLQEWAQGKGLALPQYREISREGPDHAPIFTMEVSITGMPPVSACGSSKQEAEQEAALIFLETIGDDAGGINRE